MIAHKDIVGMSCTLYEKETPVLEWQHMPPSELGILT